MLYIYHCIRCSTAVIKACEPTACSIFLTQLILCYLFCLHKVRIRPLIGRLAAPHLLHHLCPQLGIRHTPQLALGQHVEDGLRGILFRLGGADAALLHEVGVLLVGAAVKDGHRRRDALHLRLLDVEQGRPGRGGVAALGGVAFIVSFCRSLWYTGDAARPAQSTKDGRRGVSPYGVYFFFCSVRRSECSVLLHLQVA